MKGKLLNKPAVFITIIVLVLLYSSFNGFIGASQHERPILQQYLSALSNNYKPINLYVDNYTIYAKFPDTTELNLNYYIPDGESELRYSLYFNNKKLGFRGYLQMWKIEDILNFLTKSKSLSPFDYKSYVIKKINQNSFEGYLTEWTAAFGQSFISSKEYWLTINKTEYVVRISFFTDTSHFPDKLQDVIHDVLNSLNIDSKPQQQ